MFLYAKGSNFRVTIPSKSIEDIKLSEDAYKADFELSKRYLEFTKEIVRFSLLGIAGYGFMVENVVGTAHIAVVATGFTLWLIIAGLTSLVTSAGLGLYCGQLNKICLSLQVAILRLLQRKDAARWTDPTQSSVADVQKWSTENDADLTLIRECQAANLARVHLVQRLTGFVLLFGILVTAVVFVRCLRLDLPSHPIA